VPHAREGNEKIFRGQKVEVARYGRRLSRAFDVIRHFEFDLYENSVIPVAPAHRHASISLMPGGTVLEPEIVCAFLSYSDVDEGQKGNCSRIFLAHIDPPEYVDRLVSTT
jgi:hypothetical protein